MEPKFANILIYISQWWFLPVFIFSPFCPCSSMVPSVWTTGLWGFLLCMIECCLSQSCLLMDRDKISNLYRGPSIDASYQVSVHLAEGFQRRRWKCETLTDGKWWQKVTLPLARWAKKKITCYVNIVWVQSMEKRYSMWYNIVVLLL
jgi:hypothetical protein